MTPEGKVKIKINKWYKDNLPGHWRVSPRGGPFGKQGTADNLICYKGFFIAIEVKGTVDDEPTGLQINSLKAVAAAGGVAAVIKGYDVARLERIKRIVEDKYDAMKFGQANMIAIERLG